MSCRIFYKNVLRTLEADSAHAGFAVTGTVALTDEEPKTLAVATGYAGTVYELIYDLGTARTVGGVAIINHNLSTMGYTLVMLSVGTTDNGSTWDDGVWTSPNLQTYPAMEPAMASHFSANRTKRWWRIQFVTSSLETTDELKIGQLCLFNAFADLPANPAAPTRTSGVDTAEISQGLGGYESRSSVNPGAWTKRLRWRRQPGGVSVWTQVRDILRYARKYAQWGREPVAWVPYDALDLDPVRTRPCIYALMERLTDAEVLYDGTTRRYDVILELRELTYNGLL